MPWPSKLLLFLGLVCLEVRARWAVCFWWAELFHGWEEIPFFLNPPLSACSHVFGLCPSGDYQADAATEHHAGQALSDAGRPPE